MQFHSRNVTRHENITNTHLSINQSKSEVSRMDVYNFLKSFLGIPNSVPPSDFNSDRYKDHEQDGHDNLLRSEPLDDPVGFNVFSNPLEMHRYFEQQLNEVMRSFGIHTDAPFFGDSGGGHGHDSFFGGLFGGGGLPGITGDPVEPVPSPDLRDHFLKPGFEASQPGSGRGKLDSDVDGKVDMKDLDIILENKKPMSPYQQRPPVIHRQFFGQSMTTRVVTKPDGSVETHRTVRDNEGKEETTVTHRRGDKEYTITTCTDKTGKQEREEKIVNMDENEVKLLQPQPCDPMLRGSTSDWFNFDRFFK